MSVLTGVRIKQVNLQKKKKVRVFPRRDKRNCPQYPGVRIKRVSVERGSTVILNITVPGNFNSLAVVFKKPIFQIKWLLSAHRWNSLLPRRFLNYSVTCTNCIHIVSGDVNEERKRFVMRTSYRKRRLTKDFTQTMHLPNENKGN